MGRWHQFIGQKYLVSSAGIAAGITPERCLDLWLKGLH